MFVGFVIDSVLFWSCNVLLCFCFVSLFLFHLPSFVVVFVCLYYELFFERNTVGVKVILFFILQIFPSSGLP